MRNVYLRALEIIEKFLKNITITIVVSVFVIMAICMIFENDIKYKFILNFQKAVPVLFAGISLIIASTLFDKFGARKVVFEKRVKLILEILERIKNYSFLYGAMDNGLRGGHFKISIDTFDKYPELEKVKHLKVSYQNEFRDEIKYFKNISESPYIPDEIKQRLNFFPTKHGVLRNFEHYVLLTFKDTYNTDEKYYNNNQEKDLFTLINDFEEVIISLKNWIEVHTDIKLKY